MISLSPNGVKTHDFNLLALGAHCDDIEIGAGGTLLSLRENYPRLRAHVFIASSNPKRADESRASLAAFLGPDADVEIHDLQDGFLPDNWGGLKTRLERLAERLDPDLVLAPTAKDAHQDHRLLASQVTTCFRDHLVLGYEIPKWDGDLGAGRPNVYVPLSEQLMNEKWDLLQQHYPSQGNREWFDEETFFGLARLRGLESRTRYAEAFRSNKLVLGFGSQ